MATVLGGDPAGMGERLARLILGLLEDPDAGSRLTGLVRAAAAEPEAARMVRDLFMREIWTPASESIPASEPELAVNLVATQVLGLVMARYVIRAEPLASLPAEAVVTSLAPILQRLLTSDGVAGSRASVKLQQDVATTAPSTRVPRNTTGQSAPRLKASRRYRRWRAREGD